MALVSKSLFLYGFEITTANRSIDFKTSLIGVEYKATLSLGQYTLTQLLTEIERAMKAADPANTYTATAVRTYAGGLENRVNIATSGSFLSLLFATGSRASSSVATLIGFTATDHTGLTNYNGTVSAGTVLVPEYVAYSYLGPEFMRKNFGAVNIAADGTKEAITFSVQRFFQGEWKFEPQAKVISQWAPLLDWLIQQKPFEFTPEISSPTVFYEATLESTGDDGKGLGYAMKEMLPQFPFHYQTGNMKFRQIVPASGFI